MWRPFLAFFVGPSIVVGIDEVHLRRLPALDLTFGLAIEPKTSPVSGFPVFLFIIIMFSLFAIQPNP